MGKARYEVITATRVNNHSSVWILTRKSLANAHLFASTQGGIFKKCSFHYCSWFCLSNYQFVGRLQLEYLFFWFLTFITICNYSLYLPIHLISLPLPLEQKLPGYSDLVSVSHHLAQHLERGEHFKYTCEK